MNVPEKKILDEKSCILCGVYPSNLRLGARYKGHALHYTAQVLLLVTWFLDQKTNDRHCHHWRKLQMCGLLVYLIHYFFKICHTLGSALQCNCKIEVFQKIGKEGTYRIQSGKNTYFKSYLFHSFDVGSILCTFCEYRLSILKLIWKTWQLRATNTTFWKSQSVRYENFRKTVY